MWRKIADPVFPPVEKMQHAALIRFSGETSSGFEGCK
jgi:hypothetical protein